MLDCVLHVVLCSLSTHGNQLDCLFYWLLEVMLSILVYFCMLLVILGFELGIYFLLEGARTHRASRAHPPTLFCR